MTVNTVCWAGYRDLDAKGYQHKPINLSGGPSRPAGRACFADRIDAVRPKQLQFYLDELVCGE